MAELILIGLLSFFISFNVSFIVSLWWLSRNGRW